jgi:spore germination cell wall hydrolase CwlJ-like protein
MDTLTSFGQWLLGLFAARTPVRPSVSVPRATILPPVAPWKPLPFTDQVDRFSDATVLARTLWGEARSQGEEGMRAVCNVIQNRAANPGWWGDTLRDVCLDHVVEKSGRVIYQFSSWNTFDVQAARMRGAVIDDASYTLADSLALRAVTGRLPDITGGADHYYAEYISTPKWAIGKTSTFVCGAPGSRQYFYRLGLAG